MGLIEIVGVCKTNSRTNGFSEHNEEKTISYSLFSCHNGNDLLEMAEQIIDRCTQTQNSQRCFDASRLVTHREYSCPKFFVVDFCWICTSALAGVVTASILYLTDTLTCSLLTTIHFFFVIIFYECLKCCRV